MLYVLGYTITPYIMEGFVAATTIGSLIYAYNEQIAVAGVAKREGGNIKALPLDFFARIVTPIHFVAMFITPAAYLFGITVNGLSSTGWLAQYDLPAEWDVTFGEDGKLLVRAAGIFVSMAVWKLMSVVFHYLGSQWHYLGVSHSQKTSVHLLTAGRYYLVAREAQDCVVRAIRLG